MKKVVVINIFLFLIGIFLSCDKTTSINTTSTYSVVANSTLTVGDACWTYDSCNVAPNKMKAICGSCTVEIILGMSPTNASYALTSGVPTAGQAQIKITNPPSQPLGIWYSKSGFLTVTNSVFGTVAKFANISCNQLSAANPTVIASGSVFCY